MSAMKIFGMMMAGMTVVVLAVGCATNPAIPQPSRAMAEKANIPLSDIRRGHSVYLKKCGECHELMMPDQVSSSDWHVVVPGMAWNAGISREDEDAVLQYLLAAKAK